jgi:hypothetical protein
MFCCFIFVFVLFCDWVCVLCLLFFFFFALFYFLGNSYGVEVSHPKTPHRWVVFVKAETQGADQGLFIDRVEFILHPVRIELVSVFHTNT